MTNEIKFADTVILVDVAYVDRVAGDLSKHFGDVVGRKLPKADLPVLLECLSLDSGIPLGENAVQVLFIYDEESKKMDAFQPSDLEKELKVIQELLSDRGSVYIAVPGIKDLANGAYGYNLGAYLQNAHIRHFSLGTLNNIMEKYGFHLYCGNETIVSLFHYTGKYIELDCPHYVHDYEYGR